MLNNADSNFDTSISASDPNNPSFVGHPANVSDAATNFANAYDTYALDAVDYSGDAVAVVNKAGFESTLAASLPPGNPGGTPLAASAAFDNAFISYWTGATFAIGIIPPPAGICPNVGGNSIFSVELSSVVSAITPSILGNLLSTVWNSLPPTGSKETEDPSIAASAIASALHTATTTAISVLISGLDTTPIPAGPLPITNTCTVF